MRWCCHLLLVTFLALCLLQPSCARMGRGKQINSNEKIGNTRTALRPNTKHIEIAEQIRDTTIFLKANRVCQEERLVEIERTTEYTRVNETPGVTSAMAVIGGLAVLFGIVFMLNPESEDEETGEKSRIFDSQQTANITGGVILGTGAFALLFPLGDAIRKHGTDVETETRIETAEIRKPITRCRRAQPALNIEFWGDVGGKSINLGTTDEHGHLSVDLVRAVDRELVSGPTANLEMPLVAVSGDQTLEGIDSASGKRLSISLDKVRSYYDDVSWGEVDLVRCMAAASLDSCASIEAYLDEFPMGKHFTEANQHLLDVKSRMDAMREAQSRAQAIELERMRIEEEKRQRAAEQRRLEEERERKAGEARLRAEQQVAAEKERARQAARKRRRECKSKCQKSCGYVSQCVSDCVRDTCE